MIRLRNVLAASILPAQPRLLNDPLLDPRTAAYLEPATLPFARPRPASRSLRALFAPHKDHRHPRLLVGLLCFLLMLLYILAYAQEAGSQSTPYLVVPPAGMQSEYFLVPPAEQQAGPSLAMPVTGR